MTQSMIERVARAIHEYELEQGNISREWEGVKIEIDYMNMARAALTAMQSPTEDMIEAGFIAPVTWDHTGEVVDEIYQAMIRAALEEK